MPSPVQVAAVLKHLDVLRRPDLSPSQVHHAQRQADGTIIMPSEERSPEVVRLVHDLYKNEFIQAFDWSSWQEEAEKLLADPERMKDADLETLVKLLTTHVRKDRFCEGHFTSMIRSGHIQAILERLAELQSRTQQGHST